MSFPRNRTTPSVELSPALTIAFTGHRKLTDEAKCRDAIRKVLEEWKAKAPGTVYGLSSAAAGGDLLFTETCIELGLPIRILLPLQREQFRDDFDDSTWNRVERVLNCAFSVEVVGASQDRSERYYECGIETVQQSRVLIALWDGEPARGLGGTADIVHVAECQGRLVVWINSSTGVIRHVNEDLDVFRDAELEFLNGLPDLPAEVPTAAPEGLARAWFIKMDQNATHIAPQYHRLVAIPIFCSAAAAVANQVASVLGGRAEWLGLGTALGIMAVALPPAMKLGNRQIAWTRVRTAAEVSRSFLALWHAPGPDEVIGPEVVPELAGMLTSLNYLKLANRSRGQISLDEFKRQYRQERVQNQIAYFSNFAARSATKAHNYQRMIWGSIALATVVNLWLSLSWGATALTVLRWKPELALAASACFQFAAVTGALVVINDYQRRRQRYKELRHMLAEWDQQIELSPTWSTALRVASKVERALLVEVIEWRSLIRNRKMR
jgi:hypothetical protein